MTKAQQERQHRRDVEATKLLFRMSQRYRRPITRLVTTRIRGAINTRNPDWKYEIY